MKTTEKKPYLADAKEGDLLWSILHQEWFEVKDIDDDDPKCSPYRIAVKPTNGFHSFDLDDEGFHDLNQKVPLFLWQKPENNIVDFNNLPQKPRWRADDNEYFYCVNDCNEKGFYVIRKQDKNFSNDIILYKTGNYFKTKEEAQKVADQFNEILKNR